jgi:hypothetical protein
VKVASRKVKRSVLLARIEQLEAANTRLTAVTDALVKYPPVATENDSAQGNRYCACCGVGVFDKWDNGKCVETPIQHKPACPFTLAVVWQKSREIVASFEHSLIYAHPSYGGIAYFSAKPDELEEKK